MKKGFSLIEVIVYIAVLVLVFGLFTNIILSVNRSYARLSAHRNMDIAAITSMERISRAIRSASSVVVGQSTLGSNPGMLSLNQVDSGGNSINTLFQVADQNIRIRVNDTDQGVLLPSGVSVSRLIFSLIDSGRSQAVRVEMQLTGGWGNSTTTENYYSTEVLRGSYE